MTKSSRQYLCRRRMEKVDRTIRRPKEESREQPFQVPRRRRTRKSRRLHEVTSWKRELPHFLPRATKVTSASFNLHSWDAFQSSNSYRYVKSKPPKLMPGGRVISSGQGTLTEVSRSFYVAYGTTALENSQGMNINLVVPVRDELQEVTDEEMIIESSTSSYQLPSEDSNKAEIEMESSSPPKECELPIHDHPCMSMVILDSPRMPTQCVSESIQSDAKNAAFRSFMHCCLPSEELDRVAPTHFPNRLESSSNAEGQLPPMTYVPSTPVQYELPPSEFALPVPHGTESEGWYGKRAPEASWEPYLSGRNRTQLSIQEACRYRTVSDRPYSQAPSGGGYFGVLDPEVAAAAALNEKKHEQKLNKRHPQSLLHTRTSVWNGAMQQSSDGYHPYQHPDVYLSPHFAKASSRGTSSTPPCRILDLDPFNATASNAMTSPSLRAYDTSLCRQFVAGGSVGAASQNCWSRNGGIWDYSPLPSMLTTTENHFCPPNTNLLI